MKPGTVSEIRLRYPHKVSGFEDKASATALARFTATQVVVLAGTWKVTNGEGHNIYPPSVDVRFYRGSGRRRPGPTSTGWRLEEIPPVGEPAMTRRQAEAEAKSRWGPGAFVSTERPARGRWSKAPAATIFKVYRVLYGEPPRGTGATWEEAFAAADLAEQSEAAR